MRTLSHRDEELLVSYVVHKLYDGTFQAESSCYWGRYLHSGFLSLEITSYSLFESYQLYSDECQYCMLVCMAQYTSSEVHLQHISLLNG